MAASSSVKTSWRGRLAASQVKQVRRTIRPRPFKSFRERTYAAAVSPESVEIMARLGVGILIIPQKPWEVVADELKSYREIFRRLNGRDAPAPIVGGWTFCDADECSCDDDSDGHDGDGNSQGDDNDDQ